MAFNCWIASLFLLLVPVYSYNPTNNAGRNCCKIMLQSPFPRDQYRRVESYKHFQAHGKCPVLYQFKTVRGFTFCATEQFAKPLIEAIDASRIEDIPSADARNGSETDMGNTKGTTHPPSSPGESTHPHGTGIPLTEAPQGQDTSTIPPSVPPSPPSTDAHGPGSVQKSSSTAVSVPGLQGLDRMTTPPSVPPSPPSTDAHGYEDPQTSNPSTPAPPGTQRLDSSPTPPTAPPSPVATAFQGSAGPQMPISSATALPGPQSQGATSTLQTTQALPSTEPPPREDVTTAQSMKATEMASPHPENNIATAVTPAPNDQAKQQSRTGGHNDTHTKAKKLWESKHYGVLESRVHRLGVGLSLATCLIIVAIAILYVSRSWRMNWFVPHEDRDSTRCCSSDTVCILRYQSSDSDLV